MPDFNAYKAMEETLRADIQRLNRELKETQAKLDIAINALVTITITSGGKTPTYARNAIKQIEQTAAHTGTNKPAL